MSRTKLLLLGAALLWSVALGVRAQDADSMRAVPLAPGETIRLDGRLDHPAWQRAPVYSRFVEKFPVTGGPPAQETRVQVLYDRSALYVGVTAMDTQPALIRDPLVRNDQVNRTQDFVLVCIDPIGTRRSAQFFRINAAGSMADGLYTASDDSEDFSPDFDWDGATARHQQGWTAVFRLPFASLRFAEGDQDRWRILVGRRLPREQFHLMTSVLVPREAPSFIDTMQPLLGVKLPEQHAFLTVRPSLTLRRLDEQPAAGPRQRRNDVDASLDLKWRPRAELVVDGTLNPDFSQVALDVPQLAGNSRFALYFPEKRPFFFESADLLRAPTEAMYTRSFTEPRWGLRGTWRGTDLAGSAFAIDDRGGGLVLLPGPFGTGYAEQPASRTLALRARHDPGDLQWGGVLAARRYADGRGDNTVLGPDLGWRIDEAWRLRGQWLHSSTTAHDDGSGHLARAPARDGDRLFLRLNRGVPDGDTSLTLDESTAGFRHDSGFVNQAGVRRLSAAQGFAWRPLGPFNEFWLNLRAARTTDRRSGEVVEQSLFTGFWSSGARNLEWSGGLYPLAQTRSAPGAPLLTQRYADLGVVVTPAPWFPLLDASVSAGRLADTVANEVRPGLRFNVSARLRPLAPLELEPSLSLAWLRKDGRRAYDESAAQMLGVWHLGPRSNLRAIVQRSRLLRLDEPGVAGFRDAQDVSSLTWTWRQSAGTVLYVGGSRTRSSDPSRSNEAFVKLQVDVDEVRAAWPSRP